MLSEYKEVFMEELDEQLQLMDDEILKLEQEGDKGSAIQSLFRAAHTLKGSSAAMGFESMKLLTHEMEHLLDQVRSSKLDVTASLIDLLFQALDNLKQLKIEIAEGGSQTDLSGCVEEIRQFGSRTPQAQAKPEPGKGTIEVPAVPKPKLSMADRLKVAECLEQHLQVNWVLLRISESCVIKGARAYVIQAALAEAGEILYASPDPADLDEYMEGTVELALLFAGMLDAEQLRAFVSGLMDVESATVEPVQAEETAILAPPVQSRMKEAAAVPLPEQSSEQSPAVRSKAQTIRVSVERMEHLMNLVGELVIDQTRIHQVEQVQRRRFSDESVSELAHISDHLSRVISDLQDSVMKARMLPIEQLFNRFPRMVRDLSRDLGKEIEMIVEGKDTELDRTLIEEISDPLIHLIRNAVDHGIETPEIRSASGKPRKGTLVIRAAHEDNQVVIYVRDDGAGIDPAKMRASAVSKGMLTQEEADLLSDREAVGLIFHPGFSTARVVSDVSGRGVGMDIVKSHIEKLNGLIDTDTEPGQGTQFKIKLPLTLAIIEGLLVKLAAQTYIIPMSNIAEIVRIQAEQLITLRGKPVIMLRDQIIPVTWIQDHFQVQGGEPAKKHLSLVIVGSAEKRMALVVDELIGNQEIVIKSLGQYVGKVSGIAGGTILGDGRVALILEISALIQKLSGKQ